MSSVLIVGLGNVGLRHLEGCLKIKKLTNIFAVDKKNLRINFCKSFFKDHAHFKKIKFLKSTNNVNSDLAIISTNSKERFNITKKLIVRNKIKHLILEKFLTTKKSEINEFKKLALSTNIWINHIYRYQEAFIFLKNILMKKNLTQFNIDIIGNNLNVTSNLIHFVDYFSYFLNDKIPILKMFFSEKSYWKTSKRNSYREFIGDIDILFKNKSKLSIKSLHDKKKSNFSMHKIYNKNQIFLIKNLYDSQKTILEFNKKKKMFICPFISNCTYIEIEKILLNKKNIKLAKLENILFIYTAIISGFLKNYNSFFNLKKNKILPIT